MCCTLQFCIWRTDEGDGQYVVHFSSASGEQMKEMDSVFYSSVLDLENR